MLKFDGADYATYSYDIANRLATITNVSDSTNIGFGYDIADRVTSRTYPNGVNTTYEYDGMSRLTRLKDASSAATLYDRQYSYNTANQISQIAEPTQTRIFGYDNIDRLTSVTNPPNGNESYVFDAVGNRTSSHRSAMYGYQPFNRLTSTVVGNYQSDSNGNMTRKFEWGGKRWTYFWDYENRLARATNHKQTVRYIYDALGRRVQRYIAGGKENTKFIYDGSDVLVDDNSGVITKYLNNEGIDEKLRVQNGSNVSYFLTDHLGSTNGLADNGGALTASAFYDSFGNATNVNFPTRYQFTGREFDSTTGLHYYRARFYDANLGRFISEDPIGFGGGDVNLFAYVRNRPFAFRDPTGLYPPATDVLRDPNALRALATAGGAATAAFGPAAVVAAGGAAAIYGAAQVGQYTASHPSNPFVNGPLNPFGTPYPGIPMPPLSTPTRPYCQPLSRPFPITRVPTMPWPVEPEPDREGCAQEWADAYVICAAAIRRGDRGITGGYKDEHSCARGLVSQRCGGNRIE